ASLSAVRSGEYPHPADEFDAAASAGGPRGAHRAPRSRWTRWRPFLIVLVIFPVLAYGLVTWLSDWEGLAGVDLPTFSDSADDGTGEDGTGEGGTGEDTEPTDEATTPPETETEPEVPEVPPAVVDPARPVQVLNSTSTSGLASNGAAKVEEAGFTDVTSGN